MYLLCLFQLSSMHTVPLYFVTNEVIYTNILSVIVSIISGLQRRSTATCVAALGLPNLAGKANLTN